MDTIQISIILNGEKLMRMTHSNFQELVGYITNITSPYGHRYCEFIEVSPKGNLIFKFSYPRYFAGINAFLITNKEQCFQVQNDFTFKLQQHELLRDAMIQLNRVDIPFTFYMHPDYDFNSYRKIYQIFDYVYRSHNKRAKPKVYADIKDFKFETLIYSDTPSTSGYNCKIMIYDQYNNLMTKTIDEEMLYKFETDYKGLENRMRIEVSKRINRNPIRVQEFSNYKIFETYVPQYKEYLLINLFDLSDIEIFYNEKAKELADKLEYYREQLNFFNYENFIYREMQNIYDYEILRRALKICTEKGKTVERAITTIRKILSQYQQNEKIIVMETYQTIIAIRNAVINSFL